MEEYIKAASAVRNNYKFGNHNECCTMCYCENLLENNKETATILKNNGEQLSHSTVR